MTTGALRTFPSVCRGRRPNETHGGPYATVIPVAVPRRRVRGRAAAGGRPARRSAAPAAAAATPEISILNGAWHCSNDACLWASVRTVAQFDSQNHWLIDQEQRSALGEPGGAELRQPTAAAQPKDHRCRKPQRRATGYDTGHRQLLHRTAAFRSCSRSAASPTPMTGTVRSSPRTARCWGSARQR